MYVFFPALCRAGNIGYFSMKDFFTERTNYIRAAPGQKRIIFFPAFFLLCVFFRAQRIDSLIAALPSLADDTNKVDLLNRIAWKLKSGSEHKAAIAYAARAGLLAHKLRYYVGISTAHSHIGSSYKSTGDYERALAHQLAGLRLNHYLGDTAALSRSYNNLGVVYLNKGNYPQALAHYLAALNLRLALRDSSGMGTSYHNIGAAYHSMNEPRKALGYYLKGLEIRAQLNEVQNISSSQVNIGTVYADLGDTTKALEFYQQALETREAAGDKSGVATVLNNMGTIYSEKNEFQKALQYLLRSVKLKEELDDREGLAVSFNNISNLLIRQGKYREALENSLRSLELSRETGSLDDEKEALKSLSVIYEHLHDSRRSLGYYKQFVVMRDSIFNEENTRRAVQAEMNFEFSQKEAAARLEQEKRDVVAHAERKKQRVLLYSVCGFLLLVIGFAVYAWKSFLQKKKSNEAILRQKTVIEEKQKEIVDSIHYAKRIQRTLITSERYIENKLKQLNP